MMVYFSYLSYGTVCHFLALNSQFENLRFPMNFFITAGILTAGITIFKEFMADLMSIFVAIIIFDVFWSAGRTLRASGESSVSAGRRGRSCIAGHRDTH